MKKTAVITGSSLGIGAAIAQELSNENMNIVINYNRSKEQALKLLSELREKGTQSIAIKADVSKHNEALNLINTAINEFGKIDILVNNAGISCQKLFTDMSPSEFDNIFKTNLYSMFYCTQVAVRDMLKRHYGKIVNISSIWGITGASCEVAYSSSKAAVIGFTKSLAQELGPSNINVNCVAPGVIQTNMNKFLSENELEELINNTPLCRVGYPYEIAKAVKFLALPDSDFITGQIISPNGGFLV